jgi:UDP-2,4-diacetamido-2,4,6-trideoxy-beta-L-altropyranose hydrolase
VKIAIRADASLTIGSGHLMRCLCLADFLRAGGGSVRFVSRALPPHLSELVTRHGHELDGLPSLETRAQPSEASWPEPIQQQDLDQTIAALRNGGSCDWLVVDHYAIDQSWEQKARLLTRRLLVIDDLARPHDCDVLLDANLHLDGDTPYSGRLPEKCQLLLGPTYALLRPEFAHARARARPRDGTVQRLLVFMGGMDGANATGMVLRALAHLDETERPPRVDVVIGPAQPNRDAIDAWCAAWPGAQCHVSTPDMAGLCCASDLAIGAGGSATWERCAVGLPTLALCLADNQKKILHNGARAGLLYAPDEHPMDSVTLSHHLRALTANSGLRNHISRNGLAAVDAQGAQRVAAVLLQQ